MSNRPAGRGLPKMQEADVMGEGSLPEKLESVLKRIEDRPGDAPVAVSAGFLRWVATSASDIAMDATELRDQLALLTREHAEAREAADRLKAHNDRASELLKLADTRIKSLTDRIAKLRAELAAITGKPTSSTRRSRK